MTILTAVDGEAIPSRPVETGAELAAAFGERHVVLHVMPQAVFDEFREAAAGGSPNGSFLSATSYGDAGAESAAPSASDADEYSLEDGERHASGVARDVVRGTLEDPDDVVVQGRVGEPVEEILAEADRRDARYLVVGGRARTPVGKAVFGSSTQSILLHADRPVVTVMSGE